MEDLEREAREHLYFSTFDFDYLHTLRRAKAAYRSEQVIPNNTVAATNGWLDIVDHIFGMSKHIETGMSIDTRLQTLTRRNYNSRYERLRTLEGVYLIAMSSGRRHPEHELLLKHIVNPNRYGSSQVRKSHVIEKFLNEVMGILANKPIHATHFPLRYASLQKRA